MAIEAPNFVPDDKDADRRPQPPQPEGLVFGEFYAPTTEEIAVMAAGSIGGVALKEANPFGVRLAVEIPVIEMGDNNDTGHHQYLTSQFATQVLTDPPTFKTDDQWDIRT